MSFNCNLKIPFGITFKEKSRLNPYIKVKVSCLCICLSKPIWFSFKVILFTGQGKIYKFI